LEATKFLLQKTDQLEADVKGATEKFTLALEQIKLFQMLDQRSQETLAEVNQKCADNLRGKDQVIGWERDHRSESFRNGLLIGAAVASAVILTGLVLGGQKP